MKSINYRSRSQAGFSMMEMLAVIVIMFIMGAFTIPQMGELWGSHAKRSMIEQFQLDVIRAKATATAEGARGVLSMTSGAPTYTFGIDYPPYSDPAVADSTLFQTSLPDRGSIIFSQTLIFDARGFLVDSFGDLTNAGVSITYDGQSFANITILPTGVVRVNSYGS